MRNKALGPFAFEEESKVVVSLCLEVLDGSMAERSRKDSLRMKLMICALSWLLRGTAKIACCHATLICCYAPFDSCYCNKLRLWDFILCEIIKSLTKWRLFCLETGLLNRASSSQYFISKDSASSTAI